MGAVSSRIGILVAAVFLAACKDEFANAPLLTLAIDTTGGWHDTVAVSDVDTLQIKVAVAGGEGVTGVQIHWASSEPAKLEVTPLELKAGQEKDSLILELRTVITAHVRDSAVIVTATVDRPGFERKSFTRTMTVMERWIAVSAGGLQTCGVTFSGDAYCWGTGSGLGDAAVDRAAVPTAVRGGYKFTAISSGRAQVCGQAQDGLTYCWGSNAFGALGDFTQLNRRTPVAVTGGNFVTMDVGVDFACGIILDDRTTQCWGNEESGQLGRGPEFPFCLTYTDAAVYCRTGLVSKGFVRMNEGSSPAREQYCTNPDRNANLDCPLSLADVSAGADHACGIITNLGAAFCWGSNTSGQVGGKLFGDECFLNTQRGGPCSSYATLASQDTTWNTSEQLYSGPRFEKVSAGSAHTCALAVGGIPYCWGSNEQGQLGNGSLQGSPFPIPGPTGMILSLITSGGNHTCGIVAETQLAVCWGANGAGQLGNNRAGTNSSVPVEVLGGHQFGSISAGNGTTCGVATANGAVYCWGLNLGNGSTSASSVPTRVAEPRN